MMIKDYVDMTDEELREAYTRILNNLVGLADDLVDVKAEQLMRMYRDDD